MKLEELENIERRPPASVPSPIPVRPVPKPARRRGWLWLIVLILLGTAAYAAHQRYPHVLRNLLMPAKPANVRQGPRSVPVLVAQVRVGDLPIYLDGLGTVTALNTVTIRSRVDGELVKVAFVEGQEVHEGDLLAEIDPRPFQVQLAQAEGQLAKDQAALDFAKLDLARYESAPATIVTQQQRDTAVAQVGQNEGLVKSDQAQIAAIKLQLVYCRITSPLTGRVGLRLVDQGNLIHANDPNGLAVITQLEPISVVFSLSEDVLPQVLPAWDSGRSLPVIAQNRDRTVILATGSLLAVDNQVDSSTLMVKLKAAFDNKERTLYPNQAVNIRLLVDTQKNTVLIPAPAIQHSPDATTFVYVVKPEARTPETERTGGESDAHRARPTSSHPVDAGVRHAEHTPDIAVQGTVEIRTVKTSHSEGDLVSIDSGLQPGDLVVTDGVDKLQPGSRIVGQWAPPPTVPRVTRALGISSQPAESQSRPAGRNTGAMTHPGGTGRKRR